MTAPIYDGGTAASQTRQAKELAAQSRQVLDQVRNQSRTAATGAWVAMKVPRSRWRLPNPKCAPPVWRCRVCKRKRGRPAHHGRRAEFAAGSDSAKARLIGAQRDRVIASYTLLSAIGKLDVKTLALNTPDYLPEVHYHQVRDAWHACARRRDSRLQTSAMKVAAFTSAKAAVREGPSGVGCRSALSRCASRWIVAVAQAGREVRMTLGKF